MIVERIYEHARTQPQKSAMVMNGEPVSYLWFAEYIEFLRQGWVQHDLQPGSVAVVVCQNRQLGWCATLALQSLGLVTIAADKISVLKSLALRNVSCILMVNELQDDVDSAFVHWPDALKLDLPTAKQVVALPTSFVSASGGGHILFTSGTTGTYKKIFHDAALDHIRCEARLAGNAAEKESVANLTFYGPWTAAGYRQPIFLWASGSTVVFDRREDWPLHLGDHDVNRVFLTPGALKNATDALIHGSLKSGPRWAFELMVGGGVTSASLIRLAHELITPHLHLSFGCTEMFLPVMRTTAQEHDDDFWLKPMATRDIDIVDDRGLSCQDLAEGLLRIRLQFTDYESYMDDPEATSRMYRDGWFYPGDMAVRRADGRIRVLGRTADVINVRGNKRPSAALEEGVRETLDASAVCAFSGLMADNEDRVVIAVESPLPIAKTTYHQLAVQLRKIIGDVRFVEMKKFPRTSTGMLKIDRVALRKLIMDRNNPKR